jgi:hypothetical protein
MCGRIITYFSLTSGVRQLVVTVYAKQPTTLLVFHLSKMVVSSKITVRQAVIHALT